jgi:hypothetical protein
MLHGVLAALGTRAGHQARDFHARPATCAGGTMGWLRPPPNRSRDRTKRSVNTGEGKQTRRGRSRPAPVADAERAVHEGFDLGGRARAELRARKPRSGRTEEASSRHRCVQARGARSTAVHRHTGGSVARSRPRAAADAHRRHTVPHPRLHGCLVRFWRHGGTWQLPFAAAKPARKAPGPRLRDLSDAKLAADHDARGARQARKLGAVRARDAHLRAAMDGEARRDAPHELHHSQVLRRARHML